ncbi:MAG: hypothetical protein K6G84_09250 [Lachnospiraceae bacterium]|nr:hypothetical protein [Lachnospiraceae bacterium]
MATPKITPYSGKPIYIRLKDSDKAFGINQDTAKKLAVKAGALLKISNMVLINIEKMQRYMDSFQIFEL